MKGTPRVLVFGASGAIGGAISKTFAQNNWEVVAVSRKSRVAGESELRAICYDPFTSDGRNEDVFDSGAPYSAVCWAQGRNATDNVFNVQISEHLEVYKANCLFILDTLRLLLERRLLAPSARLCIISSIWANIARQDKLSYCITKSALRGLVLSASADLAKDGIMINAVLPGALDTPMTRQNLSTEQIDSISSSTYFNRLPTLDDVASLSYYLCSPNNTGITGQFIAADLGFSHVRVL
jgi:NAD(P)-dependent dehydrogenase (short-subunit alcohol dehydrogenase family)